MKLEARETRKNIDRIDRNGVQVEKDLQKRKLIRGRCCGRYLRLRAIPADLRAIPVSDTARTKHLQRQHFYYYAGDAGGTLWSFLMSGHRRRRTLPKGKCPLPASG